MKYSTLVFTLSLALVACNRNSELKDKPAAEVSSGTTATAATTDTTASTVAAAATSTAAPADAVHVIKEKSSIEFVAAKVTRDHHGKFTSFDGWLEYAGGKPVRLAFTIDVNSVETDTEKLTGHLKTPDFFDVATYPKATFTSTSITEAAPGTAGGATHVVKGIFDLHGVQKELTIPVTAQSTPDGIHAKSEFTINRHDWKIDYKGMADDLIKDNVLIRLDLAFPPPPAA